MQTITTYNGITLRLVEVEKDTYDIHIANHHLIYEPRVDGKLQSVYFGKNIELIGKKSTLTNEQVEPFVEHRIYTDTNDKKHYLNFLLPINGTMYFQTALQSFNSLLEINNIDTSKEYVILKLLNNEK